MTIAQSTANLRTNRPSRLQSWWSGVSIVFASRIATVGLAMVTFWFVVGIVSLVWTPYPPNANDFKQNLSPNGVNILGTDHLGRDILSRMMTGTQVNPLKTRLPGDAGIDIPGGVAL